MVDISVRVFAQFPDTPTAPSPPARKFFRRSDALEKDLILLSTTYLAEGEPKLKELMLAIVALHAKHQADDEVSSRSR